MNIKTLYAYMTACKHFNSTPNFGHLNRFNMMLKKEGIK